ncbi:uncharacterized protein BDV17DRAFT_297932 [Aspergillus undulatus]|uniref:uncharacterized protein n=1 Tax=Aspergillus undulatus TaxID=1810928 RepID=UPI003CCD777C
MTWQSESPTSLSARVSVVFDAPLSFEKLQESWYQTLAVRPIMQARLRRSTTAPSGLEYWVYTPTGMAKYLELQRHAPDHLKDFYCLDESHRSITDYNAGLGVGPSAPSRSFGVFVSDLAEHEDEKRCTAYNGVQNLEEILDSDRPIITLQITRFRDATLLTLSVTHIIGDLFTLKAMLKGWESSLRGVPPPPWEELGRDVFAKYGPGGELAGEDATSATPSLPDGWRLYGVVDKARLLSRALWDLYITRPEKNIQQKNVFISESEIQDLEAQAARDLTEFEKRRRAKGKQGDGRPLRVTRSNVLHAWLLKLNHTHLGDNEWSKPVTVVNTRARPPTGMKPFGKGNDFPNHDWYGAAMAIGVPSLRVGKLMTMPLGELALHIKDGIRDASTPENTRRFLSFTLHNQLYTRPTGKIALFMPPDHRWSGLTDWRLIQFQEVDFTPARDDGNTGVVEVCAFSSTMLTANSQRDCWVCMGQAGGGIWFTGIAGDAMWRNPKGFGKFPHMQRRTSKL